MAVMKRYEMMVLLDVGQSEEEMEKIIEKLQAMIENSEGGKLLSLDRWGKKRLAYEINKKQFGYYALFEFIAPSSLPAEIDRFCRLDTTIMRHMILHISDHILRLKEREEKIKAEMIARRQAAQGENGEDIVEDLLDHEIEDDDLNDDAENVDLKESDVSIQDEDVLEEAAEESVDESEDNKADA